VSREYPERPIVGVGAILRDAAGRFLLARRGRPPAEGRWSVPGGAVEAGESLREACVREAREETGLEIEVGALVEVVERIARDAQGRAQFHYVIVDYACTARGGDLRAGDDCAELRWVTLEEAARLELTEGLLEVLARVKR
jgi:ADP-ribose pyrophosphatase YjhB (NUDIX family)